VLKLSNAGRQKSNHQSRNVLADEQDTPSFESRHHKDHGNSKVCKVDGFATALGADLYFPLHTARAWVLPQLSWPWQSPGERAAMNSICHIKGDKKRHLQNEFLYPIENKEGER